MAARNCPNAGGNIPSHKFGIGKGDGLKTSARGDLDKIIRRQHQSLKFYAAHFVLIFVVLEMTGEEVWCDCIRQAWAKGDVAVAILVCPVLQTEVRIAHRHQGVEIPTKYQNIAWRETSADALTLTTELYPSMQTAN